MDLWGLSAEDVKADLVGHLLRSNASYDTFDGENKDKRGKDLLIIENRTTGDSIVIPVSSVANMPGSGLKDTLSENDFTLTYDPDVESKYAPEVLTISSGSLFPEIPKKEGENLNKDGTTASNKIPWRAHDTDYWGSEGCITGQNGNPKGELSDLFNKLEKWGVNEKTVIPISFGLGL